jgi:putative SOS response-associated peptidase YedK
MAGIWDKWISKSGEILHTFAIITTAANKLVADIHERMPLILAHDQEEKWLLSENESEIIDLLKPFPADKMEYYPVSKALNNPAYDYASLTEKT